MSLRMLATRNVAYSFIGLNTVVFAAWKYADGTIPIEFKARDAPNENTITYGGASTSKPALSSSKQATMRAMIDNFILKPDDLDKGRWWTPLTCSISHREFWHFGFNMFAFHSFAEFLWMTPAMTPLRFAGLCIGAGLTGSIGHLWHQKTTNGSSRAAMGASGVVMSAATMCAFIAPQARWQIILIPIGIPAWAMMGLYFAYDALYLNDANSRVGHAGHIGGALFGAAYYLLLFRRPALARNLRSR